MKLHARLLPVIVCPYTIHVHVSGQSVCVQAPPGVFGSAGEHGQPRARAAAGDDDGEKIRMQQLIIKGRLRGGRARACYK